MDSSLHPFIRQFVGTVAAALLPVVLVAFWTIPFNLGGHPDEERVSMAQTSGHMT
ncbi:MAG: hypothetical protein ACXWCV_03840 [Caldimonas sp.]